VKRVLVLCGLVLLAAFAAFAQKIEKPTLTPKPLTDSQQAMIREGIAHHDAKEYDKAIAKYEAVLKDNPDATLALYEMALSQYTKGDKTKAVETSLRGSKYRSQELALFYGTIANVIDDAGKPKDAIKLYNDALKLSEERA
jgi:tetratricopeptide (TPR) repeat protein